MTTLESLVAMATITLRAKGQWQGGATAYAEIDEAVNQCADVLRSGTEPRLDFDADFVRMAIAEVKRAAALRA